MKNKHLTHTCIALFYAFSVGNAEAGPISTFLEIVHRFRLADDATKWTDELGSLTNDGGGLRRAQYRVAHRLPAVTLGKSAQKPIIQNRHVGEELEARFRNDGHQPDTIFRDHIQSVIESREDVFLYDSNGRPLSSGGTLTELPSQMQSDLNDLIEEVLTSTPLDEIRDAVGLREAIRKALNKRHLDYEVDLSGFLTVTYTKENFKLTSGRIDVRRWVYCAAILAGGATLSIFSDSTAETLVAWFNVFWELIANSMSSAGNGTAALLPQTVAYFPEDRFRMITEAIAELSAEDIVEWDYP